LLDVSKIKKLGWQPTISLPDGVAQLYEWFLDNYAPQSMASTR
jgi:GDP-L-fucose synthase